MPWANTDRVFCADSYLALVPAAEEFWKHGIQFMGIIKTEMRKFPMAYLSNIWFHNRGDMSGLLTRPVDSKNPVLSIFIMDWNRQYFVFTGVSIDKGHPYTRM